MKKLSSVFYMWVGLGFGLLAVLMMFIPFASYDGGYTLSAAKMFWGMGSYGGAWPSFVGYMFILLGALLMGVMALPFIQPTIKTEKIVLISSVALIIVGALLIGLTSVWYSLFNGAYDNLDYFLPGFYITLTFSLIAAAMGIIALTLDW